MISIISPSKTQDFSVSLRRTSLYESPLFAKEAEKLIIALRHYSPEELASLMDISPKLAMLNYERFQEFTLPFLPDNAREAVMAFRGDVYDGLDAENFDNEELAFGQEHLRILSGLYGILKPLDLIQPYRLEMKTPLKTTQGKNLYEFWGTKITDTLTKSLAGQPLINLASEEYFKVITQKKLRVPVITPVFKEYKNGKYSTIALFAKKARGMMVRFIIKNRIDDASLLPTFAEENYCFDAKLSNENTFVFVR